MQKNRGPEQDTAELCIPNKASFVISGMSHNREGNYRTMAP